MGSNDMIPRFEVTPDGRPGYCTFHDRLTDERVTCRTAVGVVEAMFGMGATVVQVDTAGQGLALAQRLAEWEAIIVRDRNNHTVEPLGQR